MVYNRAFRTRLHGVSNTSTVEQARGDDGPNPHPHEPDGGTEHRSPASGGARIMRWNRVPSALASLLGLLLTVRPAGAWVTLMDNDKGKAELETRFMFWGVDAGKDSVPSGTTPQEDRIEDFS